MNGGTAPTTANASSGTDTAKPGGGGEATKAAASGGDDAAKASAAQDAEWAKPGAPDKAGSAAADASKESTPATAGNLSEAARASKVSEAAKAGKDSEAAKAGAGEEAGAATGGGAIAAGAAAKGGPGVSKKRRFHPVAAAGRAGRATATWAKGPSGRVILPGIVVVALVVLAATSGAYLVPRALEAAPVPSATPTFTGGESAAPGASWGVPSGPPASFGALPPVGNTAIPGVTGLPGGPATANAARPADALAAWAQQVGTRVGIPVVAVQAYGYAELVAAKQTPSCHLSWTTLAAIGKIESGHGSHEGAVLGANGVAEPTIYGLPLDGQGGRQLIRDTDRGALDKDLNFDRAVGPMQFIPATWQATAVDADNDGMKNPNDIDDAALTAAAYLCKGGRDLSKPELWWEAVLTYNDVRQYAQDVFNWANDYGLRSRT